MARYKSNEDKHLHCRVIVMCLVPTLGFWIAPMMPSRQPRAYLVEVARPRKEILRLKGSDKTCWKKLLEQTNLIPVFLEPT